MKFLKKILRTGGIEKLSFFELAIFFCSKTVTNYEIGWMGLNFDVFSSFQQIPCVILCYTHYENKLTKNIRPTDI